MVEQTMRRLREVEHGGVFVHGPRILTKPSTRVSRLDADANASTGADASAVGQSATPVRPRSPFLGRVDGDLMSLWGSVRGAWQ